MGSKSSQTIGIENAEKLLAWIKVTPTRDVPIYSKGKCSKRAICKLLQITYSTIGSNSLLKQAFKTLDDRIKEHNVNINLSTTEKIICGSNALGFLQLIENLEEARAELARLDYLRDTGVWIPKR